MAEQVQKEKSGVNVQNIISLAVTALAVLGTVAIVFYAFKTFAGKDANGDFKNPQAAEEVLDFMAKTLLPLWGTWMGTILAFYFSKENFKAATDSTKLLFDKVSAGEQLSSIEAQEKMLKLNEMKYLQLETGKTEADYNLKELLQKYLGEPKYNRLPVFDENLFPKYIIHRSLIDKYLVDKSMINGDEVASLTLESMVSDSVAGPVIKNSFTIAKATTSLKNIKVIMEAKTDSGAYSCSDAFITENGKLQSSVIGWVTNVIIAENSHVK